MLTRNTTPVKLNSSSIYPFHIDTKTLPFQAHICSGLPFPPNSGLADQSTPSLEGVSGRFIDTISYARSCAVHLAHRGTSMLEVSAVNCAEEGPTIDFDRSVMAPTVRTASQCRCLCYRDNNGQPVPLPLLPGQHRTASQCRCLCYRDHTGQPVPLLLLPGPHRHDACSRINIIGELASDRGCPCKSYLSNWAKQQEDETSCSESILF